MSSTLADELRSEQREREARLTPEARVRLALELGARDLRAFASARNLSLAEAHRELRRAAQAGRARSGAMDGGR